MKTKIISITIILLCFISIIVGIMNNNSIKKSTAKNPSNKNVSVLLKKFSTGGNKIALISLQGPISADTSNSILGDMNSAESALKALEKAVNDKSVKGVLLRINSPGGTVAMSQELYSAVLRIRTAKPVVVSMGDVAASGGYYAASAADRIFADPGTLTGSIGVIMGTLNIQELLTQKLGIEPVIIKSGKFKDTGSMYRKMTAEEKTLMQNLINSAYDQFLNAIINGRINRKDSYEAGKTILTEQNLKKYADGRVLTGEQAYKTGFVDKLGGLYEAKVVVRKMAKEKFPSISTGIPVVTYNKPTGLNELFFGMAESVLPYRNIESNLPLSIKYPRQPLFILE